MKKGIFEITEEIEAYAETYIRYVHSEVDSYNRSKMHTKLCEKLGIEDEISFRPFESIDINKIPTLKELRKILWKAIENYKRPEPIKTHKLISPNIHKRLIL